MPVTGFIPRFSVSPRQTLLSGPALAAGKALSERFVVKESLNRIPSIWPLGILLPNPNLGFRMPTKLWFPTTKVSLPPVGRFPVHIYGVFATLAADQYIM